MEKPFMQRISPRFTLPLGWKCSLVLVIKRNLGSRSKITYAGIQIHMDMDYDALLYTLRSSFNSTLSIAFKYVSRNLCVTTSAYFDNNLKSFFIHTPVEAFEENSKRRTLFSTIIGSQTECADFDCENRKTDCALPNTPFYGTYRLMESRLNLSARST
ncbi:hypothetical protein ALC57_02266 [Trachymyrmex cornetzi]|uniref:Uncharacterized protein n=1 Tax=Trachymyrmex cornetzi TaxID=471704 RepID=A0A195EJ68_9HYME|nr:hypothetical protein ALC57_02266 [Trachymyrmex cornetzi]